MEMPEIDVDQLEAQLGAGAPLIDVREEDEYADAHIAGARLVPLATVPDDLDAFRSPGEVYVICAKGGRSAQAVQFLRDRGINAVNVAGGMNAWLSAAKPAVAGAGPA